jgi:hypothetical protein
MSTTTTTPSKNPLSDHAKKTLAELVESNGGLLSFKGRRNHKLSRLLDSQAETEIDPIFGHKGDKIRRKSQLLVLKWQQKHESGTYIRDVLDYYGIRSTKTTRIPHLTPSNLLCHLIVVQLLVVICLRRVQARLLLLLLRLALPTINLETQIQLLLQESFLDPKTYKLQLLIQQI